MTPRELAETGCALFGAQWRCELARALGLPDDSMIRAVEMGRAAAPPHWRAQLIALAQDAALRAMDAASMLLWRESNETAEAPQPHAVRLA